MLKFIFQLKFFFVYRNTLKIQEIALIDLVEGPIKRKKKGK